MVRRWFANYYLEIVLAEYNKVLSSNKEYYNAVNVELTGKICGFSVIE